MGSLFADLTSKPQRETAGSDAAARFDYQKDWAFCEMMRKHIADESYLIAFEYHDDVLFLSPADHPTCAEFHQVKTSAASKPRTLTSITTRPKGKSSIVGKMLSNFEGICSTHDVRVVLVSNNAFEFADHELCAKDLDEKLRKRLLEKLKAEIPNFDEKRLEKLHFLVTGVSVEAMQTFLEGKALDLFCQKFGEDHGLNIRTWIRLIKSEIVRRNNYPSDKVKTTNDLIENKCINQPLVEKTLSVIHNKSRKSLDISTISAHLNNNGWTLVDILKIQKNIPEASKDFYNPLNDDVKNITDIMRDNAYDNTGTIVDITTFITKSITDIIKNESINSIYKKKYYLCALGIMIYYEEL